MIFLRIISKPALCVLFLDPLLQFDLLHYMNYFFRKQKLFRSYSVCLFLWTSHSASYCQLQRASYVKYCVALLCLLLCHGTDELLDDLYRPRRSSLYPDFHNTIRVDDYNTSHSPLCISQFAHSNALDECAANIAEQIIPQVLLGLERRVGLGTVHAQTINVEPGRLQLGIVVAEHASLGGASWSAGARVREYDNSLPALCKTGRNDVL